MPISDHVVINVRERPLSTDIMDAESLMHRVVLDGLMYGNAAEFPGQDNTNTPNLLYRNLCVGLQVRSPGVGTTVSVSAGALYQKSATLAPTPGSLDSPYRVGFNRTSLAVTLPVPASTTFYLLEAQVSESITSTSRDIMDPASGNFVSTAVPKRKTYGITTQWTAGTTTNYPTPTGGDWVVLCGIKVDNTGSHTGQVGVVDMRPLIGGLATPNRGTWTHGERPLIGTPLQIIGGSLYLTVDRAVAAGLTNTDVNGGLVMHCRPNDTLTGFDPATIKEPATIYSADGVYYIYLCPWNGLTPGTLGDGVSGYGSGRGLLLISSTPPSSSTTNPGYNSAGLSLYAPFAATTIATGSVPCVGRIKRNSANTDWVPPANSLVAFNCLNLRGTFNGSFNAWEVANNGDALCKVDSGIGYVSLDPYLLDGQGLSYATVRVYPGAARATVGNRMQISVMRRKIQILASAWTLLGSTATDSGTHTEQLVTIAVNEVVDKAQYSYAIMIQGGNDASANFDHAYGGVLTVIPPTPDRL